MRRTAFNEYNHRFADGLQTMPSIEIHRPHQMSISEAHAIVEKVAARMNEKFGMQGQWEGELLRFSRQGVNGTIEVSNNAIQVSAQLGLMLTPMKGLIEQEIRRKLDEHFA